MKTRISFIIGILLLSCSIANSKEVTTGANPSPKGTINVYASPELYNLTTQWANEYLKVNPAVKINVIKSSAKSDTEGMPDTGEGIKFISSESYSGLNTQSMWSIVLGRDVIVPVMNTKNPLLDEICRKGITSDWLAWMFESPKRQNWGLLLGKEQNIPLNYYTFNDLSVSSGVANFLKNDQPEADGFKTSSAQEMISAIQNDPNSFGFCKFIQLIDPKNQNLADNIKLVPIDKNGNGKIDFMEDIYDNAQDFSRGVWIGKYPKALSGNIYSVSNIKPKNEAEVAFLNWVLTDGQQFLNSEGYCNLVINERQTQMDKLNSNEIYLAAPKNDTSAFLKVALLIFILFILIGFIFDLISRPFRSKTRITQNDAPVFSSVFDEDSMIIPKGLYFDKTHTWAFMEKDGTVKVGIDDFMQHIIGPLSRIGMKPAGVKIKKGDPLVTIIQKGKHLIIYSPVSGTITTYNKNLINNSSAINTSPYTDGWIYTIEPTNWLLEIQFLRIAEQYKTWLKGEFSRLKDFLATALKVSTHEYIPITLQDGGAIKDSVLADLGPEVWEDFQTKFIDIAK
jgi:glycine cleavage system H lipoate-binding protein/ABC-type phosphate transport system substrate-binding protein